MFHFAVHYIFEYKFNNREDIIKFNFWRHHDLVGSGQEKIDLWRSPSITSCLSEHAVEAGCRSLT